MFSNIVTLKKGNEVYTAKNNIHNTFYFMLIQLLMNGYIDSVDYSMKNLFGLVPEFTNIDYATVYDFLIRNAGIVGHKTSDGASIRTALIDNYEDLVVFPVSQYYKDVPTFSLKRNTNYSITVAREFIYSVKSARGYKTSYVLGMPLNIGTVFVMGDDMHLKEGDYVTFATRSGSKQIPLMATGVYYRPNYSPQLDNYPPVESFNIKGLLPEEVLRDADGNALVYKCISESQANVPVRIASFELKLPAIINMGEPGQSNIEFKKLAHISAKTLLGKEFVELKPLESLSITWNINMDADTKGEVMVNNQIGYFHPMFKQKFMDIIAGEDYDDTQTFAFKVSSLIGFPSPNDAEYGRDNGFLLSNDENIQVLAWDESSITFKTIYKNESTKAVSIGSVALFGEYPIEPLMGLPLMWTNSTNVWGENVKTINPNETVELYWKLNFNQKS